MALYTTLFTILVLLSFLEIISKDKTLSRLGFLSLVAIMFTISFIRWETGTDWESYYMMYNWVKIPWEDFNTGMEIGYIFINHLGKFLFDSYTGTLFLFATILYGCTLKSYIYFSNYYITSLLISFCISFAGIFFVRQSIALSILLVSLIFVDKRKFWLFLLTVYIASLFHRTSWIFLMVYPIYHSYFKTRTLILIIGSSLILSLAASKFFISFIGNLGLGVISQKIETYLEMGADDNTTTISTTTILIKGLINRLFLLILFFFFLGKDRIKDTRLNGLINIYILGTILYCATLPISISLARIAVYMDMAQIFITVYLIDKQNKLINKLLFWGILVLYFSARLYSNYTSFEYEYSPFTTIFD